MFKGSRAVRFIGLVELANSLVMFIVLLFLYFDFKSSPSKNMIEMIYNNYGVLRLVMVGFELYKLIIAGYASARADYTESSVPLFVNSIILTLSSCALFYFSLKNYMDIKDKMPLFVPDYDMTKEIILMASFGADILLMIALFIASYMNHGTTVVVNSWGEGRGLEKYNIPPQYSQPQQPQYPQYTQPQQEYYPQQEYGQQEYYQQDGYTQQYYDENTYAQDGYYEDGYTESNTQEYYDDTAQEYYPQEDENGGV